ncbi:MULTISPECIES: BCCT family transporter [Micrococcus]|uniref:BCCT family transporter n=1 Tax=Micrococcus lylae TaxID=1273 RepID=A0ABY2K4K4_9MICC|nr:MULTISPECIES: BCCT family transporter [Micrococcus]PNL17958.1 BCCT family transporter [Micrococcus sp. FDAARGOS_333]TFI00850.1 BCCT family transporter [Micrococcus lylae]WIK82837.1 BCCT family transporter [Micrococcus lylae]
MLTRLHNSLGLRTNPQIFFVSAAIVVVFSALMVLVPGAMQAGFGAVAAWIAGNLGWFYVLAITGMILFAFGIAFSRYGRLKLGDDDATPEYSGLAWFGMLFAAGMGATLMFWGVAEPVSHFADPPMYGTEPETVQAASEAMGIANFHLGLHMWGIFIVPALAFAYFTYKRKLPPRMSSAFQPLIGEKIHGPIGKAIDILAVVATIFGISVSVGQGALQINSGANIMFGVPIAGWVQAAILAIITAVALMSVVAGLDKGVKRLSYINITIAIALLIYILMFGATTQAVQGTVESIGQYLTMIPALAFFNTTWSESDWTGDWAVFYFAWTATWAPFVGMFIARISRGRTIRQFVLGVLLLPTAFTFIWLGVMGVNAFKLELAGEANFVETIVEEGDIPGSLFQFLGHFPLLEVTSMVALICITVFFITSIDSAALVIDSMSSGYDDVGPTRQRVFWAISIGLVCTVLLTTTGEESLSALQEVIKVIGLPVTMMMFLQALCLVRAVREDYGGLAPIRTRQWKPVIPIEEYHRRAGEDEHDISDYSMRPAYEEGTEPEFDRWEPRGVPTAGPADRVRSEHPTGSDAADKTSG